MKRIISGFIIIICVFMMNIPMQAQQQQKEWVIVLDAGHGGKDPGAVNKGLNLKEKDITLAIALKLGSMLENLENVKVVYTRETDIFLELHKRAKIANDNKADLFISIHCNAVSSSKPYGAETWVMGLHKSKANLELAKKENAAVLLEEDYETKYDGFDPNSPEADIIFSLYQNQFLEQSVDFATKVQEQITSQAKRFDRGVKQAGFIVLYKTTMPGILIEAGFISNKNEGKYLNTDAGQKAIAKSVYDAFKTYKKSVDGQEAKEKTSPEKTEDPKETEKKDTEKKDTEVKKDDPEKTDKPDKKDEPKADDPKPDKTKKDPAKAEEPSVYFSVQLISSSAKMDLSDPMFKGIPDVHMYQQGGSFKYVAGKFTSVSDAVALKNKVREGNFKDAFVIAFANNERVSIDKAKSLLKK